MEMLDLHAAHELEMLHLELVCGSVKHFSLANLTALAARFHDGLHPHGVFDFTNECGSAEVPAWPEIPSGLDVISIDVYNTGAREVAMAQQVYEKFLPLLKPHQSVWLVPGLFGADNMTAMAANDVGRRRAKDYWGDQLALVRSGGKLQPPKPASPLSFGGDSFPKTLAWIAAKVVLLAPPAAATGI